MCVLLCISSSAGQPGLGNGLRAVPLWQPCSILFLVQNYSKSTRQHCYMIYIYYIFIESLYVKLDFKTKLNAIPRLTLPAVNCLSCVPRIPLILGSLVLSRSSLTFHPYFTWFVSLQQISCVPSQFVSLVSRECDWSPSMGFVSGIVT